MEKFGVPGTGDWRGCCALEMWRNTHLQVLRAGALNDGTAAVIKTHFLSSLYDYILLEQGNLNNIHTIHFTMT